ncbi:hypothetical protein [Bordetella sp. N]|uniref:hypothetical protein n=1 Tax=Bordetella sp. N TaxID=1746199 RepID=UPI000ABADE3B|nr:hypothetical protein [Bordetella sp. N]
MTVVRLVCGLALIVTLGGCFDGSHDSDDDSDPTTTTPSTPSDPGTTTPETPAQCTTMHCAPAP